jgi:hypothetical protein
VHTQASPELANRFEVLGNQGEEDELSGVMAVTGMFEEMSSGHTDDSAD